MILEIEGPVKGKGRPRATGRGNFIRFYTPVATKVYEDLIRLKFMAARCKMFEPGPLHLSVTVWHKAPKRLWATHCEKKPDIDNVIKLVMDALTGLAYEDDNRVCLVEGQKLYGPASKLVIGLLPATNVASNWLEYLGQYLEPPTG